MVICRPSVTPSISTETVLAPATVERKSRSPSRFHRWARLRQGIPGPLALSSTASPGMGLPKASRAVTPMVLVAPVRTWRAMPRRWSATGPPVPESPSAANSTEAVGRAAVVSSQDVPSHARAQAPGARCRASVGSCEDRTGSDRPPASRHHERHAQRRRWDCRSRPAPRPLARPRRRCRQRPAAHRPPRPGALRQCPTRRESRRSQWRSGRQPEPSTRIHSRPDRCAGRGRSPCRPRPGWRPSRRGCPC